MYTPEFIVDLRKHIGHQQLFLPSCTMIIVRPAPAGASIWEVPQVLLATRAHNGNWAAVTEIWEPGEEVAQTAVREVKEEVGVDAKVEALLGVGMVGPTTFDNGDECLFMDTSMRLSVAEDAEPFLGDDENTEVDWFSVAH